MDKVGFCKCGCGKEVKKGNKYIHGHNRRGKASFTSNGRWSMKYDCCRECGTINRKHHRDGYCSACARRLKRSGDLVQKRDLTGGRWSKKYDSCRGCGTVGRPHHAHGFCDRCLQKQASRKIGRPERSFGAWSWYYDVCKKCGTDDDEHYAKGMCYNCYEEYKREQKGVSLTICPVCGVKTERLQQHIAMKARKCKDHLKLYNKVCDDIVEAFSSDKTSQQVSDEFNTTKRRVLNIWHENFTTEEIRKRGECIRVSKISGDNNYLYGKPAPLISNNLIKFTDKNNRFFIMRSTWEIKYAEYLDDNNVIWEYEKYKFKYYDEYERPHYYFPDFYLPETDEFIEIKGYMDNKSEYKILECSKKHGIKIKVLMKEDLTALGINV